MGFQERDCTREDFLACLIVGVLIGLWLRARELDLLDKDVRKKRRNE